MGLLTVSTIEQQRHVESFTQIQVSNRLTASQHTPAVINEVSHWTQLSPTQCVSLCGGGGGGQLHTFNRLDYWSGLTLRCPHRPGDSLPPDCDRVCVCVWTTGMCDKVGFVEVNWSGLILFKHSHLHSWIQDKSSNHEVQFAQFLVRLKVTYHTFQVTSQCTT